MFLKAISPRARRRTGLGKPGSGWSPRCFFSAIRWYIKTSASKALGLYCAARSVLAWGYPIALQLTIDAKGRESMAFEWVLPPVA